MSCSAFAWREKVNSDTLRTNSKYLGKQQLKNKTNMHQLFLKLNHNSHELLSQDNHCVPGGGGGGGGGGGAGG